MGARWLCTGAHPQFIAVSLWTRAKWRGDFLSPFLPTRSLFASNMANFGGILIKKCLSFEQLIYFSLPCFLLKSCCFKIKDDRITMGTLIWWQFEVLTQPFFAENRGQFISLECIKILYRREGKWSGLSNYGGGGRVSNGLWINYRTKDKRPPPIGPLVKRTESW